MTQVVTTDELVDDVLDTYKMILENIDDYLTLEQFNIIKDYFIVKRKFNEIETYKNVGKFMTPEVFQIDSILDTITYEECKEIFNEYGWSYTVSMIIRNKKRFNYFTNPKDRLVYESIDDNEYKNIICKFIEEEDIINLQKLAFKNEFFWYISGNQSYEKRRNKKI